VEFGTFVAPGLIMMSILNNAFANSSSSLLQAKMNGLIGDFLTPPLTPPEHVAAFALGAATRGILVGAVTWLAIAPFTHLPITHPGPFFISVWAQPSSLACWASWQVSGARSSTIWRW